MREKDRWTDEVELSLARRSSREELKAVREISDRRADLCRQWKTGIALLSRHRRAAPLGHPTPYNLGTVKME